MHLVAFEWGIEAQVAEVLVVALDLERRQELGIEVPRGETERVPSVADDRRDVGLPTSSTAREMPRGPWLYEVIASGQLPSSS